MKKIAVVLLFVIISIFAIIKDKPYLLFIIKAKLEYTFSDKYSCLKSEPLEKKLNYIPSVSGEDLRFDHLSVIDKTKGKIKIKNNRSGKLLYSKDFSIADDKHFQAIKDMIVSMEDELKSILKKKKSYQKRNYYESLKFILSKKPGDIDLFASVDDFTEESIYLNQKHLMLNSYSQTILYQTEKMYGLLHYSSDSSILELWDVHEKFGYSIHMKKKSIDEIERIISSISFVQ